MERVYTIEEIKSIVAPIAAIHDVDRIYLFGSYARGEATPSSDIDLRVDKGRLRGLIALGALYADLEDGLGKKLDLLTTGSLDQKFLQHIAKEEVLIYAS
ncbi:MAG: nucleotidyltransferase domain-containing protein [Oscillospiraceae bacterium]|jgi:predicted nucleotidyltransferase|nr:nucleotidyltransferase domain-containing protein [Oscillospiraceae bacterium]